MPDNHSDGDHQAAAPAREAERAFDRHEPAGVHGVVDRLRTPLWIFDVARTRVVWANRAGLLLWRAESLDELVARDLGADMSPSVRSRLEQYLQDIERSDAEFTDIWTLYPAGRPTTVRMVFRGHVLADGRTAMLCEALEEISDTPARMRSADALMHMPTMITLFDRKGRVLHRNPAARDSWADDAGGLAARMVDKADHDRLMALLAHCGQADLVARVETRIGLRWHEISARCCHDAAGGGQALLISETDVTAHKLAEEQVRYLAEHDTLTGLPNRSFLQKEVTRRIETARLANESIGLLFVDLDRFKTINDSLGHSVGDALLINVARRLSGAVGAADFVARLGGDEFLVCLRLGTDENRAADMARRLLEALEAPTRIGDVELTVTASIGVGTFPRDGEDLDTLMRHADLAMYAAKDLGCNRWVGFSTEMRTEIETQLELESALRRALEFGEFEIFYQPRLSIGEDRIVGAEALLRWHHPTRGLVMPGTFIPFAEKTGLIDRIGACVLRDAALQQRLWREDGLDVTISVNLSARQFRDPRLVKVVTDIVAETGCDPSRLQIEITESMLIGDDKTSSETLAALSALGFSIAIDDFGTGYSNLGTIQDHPIDTLKIDRSFVATLETRPALAELIIGMCRLLDMRIVAEGVETEEQLDWLRARNCEEYQGYLFSPAIPADDFEALLRRQAMLETGNAPASRSPLWDLVPLVEREGDVDWHGPEKDTSKIRRLRVGGGFAQHAG